MITLDSLIGLHMLSGVDFSSHEGRYATINTMSFVFDGVTYTASEDENDSYRSSMEELVVGGEVTNTFVPQQVMCIMRKDDRSENHKVLDCYDTTTGKLVLSVGTESWDDYYPTYIAQFDPTAMACNQGMGFNE